MSASSDKYASTELALLDAITSLAKAGADSSSGSVQNEARANLIAAAAGALEVVQHRTGPHDYKG